MKKVLVILAIFTVFAVGAFAQAPQPFSLYIGGAVSLPNSPDGFKDAYNTGYHASVGAGYKFMPNFQLVGKAEYHNFSADWGDVTGIEGGNNKMWMFGADGRYAFNLPASPIKPFIFGGAGFANMSIGDFSGSNTALVTAYNDANDVSVTKMYFNLGAGSEFKIGPAWSFFFQGRYVSVQTDGDAYTFIPVTLGLKFF